jgi:hypothetical protein
MACERKGAFAVELADLNGTWQPDWSYKASAKMADSEKHYSKWEYSWGTATSIPNTTFEIDLGDKKPFVSKPGLGGFPITEIKKTGTNEITVKAFRGDRDNPGAQWEPVLVFHFICLCGGDKLRRVRRGGIHAEEAMPPFREGQKA